MIKKNQLVKQVQKVITMLEQNYLQDIENKKDILGLIYKRYVTVLWILKNDENVNRIIISGGVRGYLDSYNDYDNPLLGELYKAEMLLKEINESDFVSRPVWTCERSDCELENEFDG